MCRTKGVAPQVQNCTVMAHTKTFREKTGNSKGILLPFIALAWRLPQCRAPAIQLITVIPYRDPFFIPTWNLHCSFTSTLNLQHSAKSRRRLPCLNKTRLASCKLVSSQLAVASHGDKLPHGQGKNKKTKPMKYIYWICFVKRQQFPALAASGHSQVMFATGGTLVHSSLVWKQGSSFHSQEARQKD